MVIPISLWSPQPYKAEYERPCKKHPLATSCRLPKPLTVDFSEMCNPCQPFSTLKSGCGSKTPSEHKLYSATFGEEGSLCSVLSKILSHRHVTEQVQGFRQPYDREVPDHTPLNDLIEKALAIRRPGSLKHYDAWIVLSLDIDAFMKGSRYR